MVWALENWKLILTFILTVGLGFFLHTVDVDRIEAQNRLELTAQKSADEQQCTKDKQITSEVSNGYQIKIAALNLRHAADTKRLRVNKTCAIVAISSGGDHAAAGTNGLPRSVGIEAGDIIDDAAACDRNTQQLISCQEFIKKVWANK